MSSSDDVQILGALFSEYWKHLEAMASPAALQEWLRPSCGAQRSASTSSASPTTTRLPPLNWTCMAAQFYSKTGMLLLPEHLMDCYLTVLEEQCDGEVATLHRLFAPPPSCGGERGADGGRSRKGEASGSASGSPGRRTTVAHSTGGGGVSPPATANITPSPGRVFLSAVDDEAHASFEGDPMSPLGRRERGPSFASRTERHDVSYAGVESLTTREAGVSGATTDQSSVGREERHGAHVLANAQCGGCGSLFHESMPPWVRGLSAEQQQRLQRLRHETPLSPEILAQLLEQLSLVEGAPLFMNPVQPHTMMMYNGVSAGPYKHVIYKPMCLAVMKANVTESRRQYHLRAMVLEAPGDNAVGGADRRGVKRPRTSGGGGPGAGTSAGTNVGEAGNAHELVMSETGSFSRVLTLADVERAVWQTAANCAMFNAPESDYPLSARRFAVRCMKVLEEYCHQQILAE